MYLQYLRHHYPELKIESVLEAAGIAPYQIEDPAHWFTQEENDRLNAVIVSSRPVMRTSPSRWGSLPPPPTAWGRPNSTCSG